MTSHYLLTSSATEATSADLAALDLAYRERMDACPCPACAPSTHERPADRGASCAQEGGAMNGKGQYYSNLVRREHYLYRIYSGDVLLYVGVTVNPAGRIPRHRRRAWWAQVTEIRTDLIGTREEALDAERRAITTEKPVHNITHATPDRQPTGGAR